MYTKKNAVAQYIVHLRFFELTYFIFVMSFTNISLYILGLNGYHIHITVSDLLKDTKDLITVDVCHKYLLKYLFHSQGSQFSSQQTATDNKTLKLGCNNKPWGYSCTGF